MTEHIPEELRRFLLTSVPSVPFVEAMLLFKAAGREPLETDFVARRLYMSDRAAAEVVGQLRQSRIVQAAEGSPSAHCFAPDSEELRRMLDMLADYYRSHLVAVTDIIHSKTARKAQQFADAFKLRKD